MKGVALLRLSWISATVAGVSAGVSLFLTYCASSSVLPPALAYALLVLP